MPTSKYNSRYGERDYQTKSTEQAEYDRRVDRQREVELRDAQELLRRVKFLEPQLKVLYDDVKYKLSGGGWPVTRSLAADAVNALGQLGMELGKSIEHYRAQRRK